MSQFEINSEIVSWFIDSTSDYDIQSRQDTIDTQSSQDTIVEEWNVSSAYVESRDYLADFNPDDEYNRTRMILETFSNTNYDPGEDFIPFVNRVNKSPINFIVNGFYLSEEEKTCCICIDEKHSEQICKLNCCHMFCVECINICLERNSMCPLCRTSITDIRTQTFEARHKIKH